MSTNITLSISGLGEQLVNENTNVKWTEIARNAILEEAIKLKKQQLLEKHVKKIPFTEGDIKFMEDEDWHPVDEFKIKKEFGEELIKSAQTHFKKHGYRTRTIEDLEKNFKS